MMKVVRIMALLMIFSACGESKFGGEIPLVPPVVDSTQTTGPSVSAYDERYRPQIHYTPSENWINDPNGLVYADGKYHLFYQYNPQGNDWGNMSWGHAVSEDLLEWKELPVALKGDVLGAIFSGSAVVDKDNTAGFGKDAVVAFYTSAGKTQQQSLAYSDDGGFTFVKYQANPVVPNTEKPDFRDPKVFWHEESGSWVMVLALGWSHGIEILTSPDLRSWESRSVFTTDLASCRVGQWECPDLLRMDFNGEEKWVMIVSVNPGGPVAGSGTMYFPGSFDGKDFVCDERDYPLWLDYGTDNYAGVTWSNISDRTVYIGWMNNWLYSGAVPCSPWRSAMTLPRELSLKSLDGEPVLASKVVREIESIAGEWEDASDGDIGVRDAYQLRLNLDMTRSSSYALTASDGSTLEFGYTASSRTLSVSRNAASGDISFSSVFSFPSIRMPLHESGDKVSVDVFVDRSSVEFISQEGMSAMTLLVFPDEIYSTLSSPDGIDAEVRTLYRIWN